MRLASVDCLRMHVARYVGRSPLCGNNEPLLSRFAFANS